MSGRNNTLVVSPNTGFHGCSRKRWIRIQPKSEANIKAGFGATGICPLNRQKVLKRLPGAKEMGDVSGVPGENQFSPQLVQLLKEERFGKRTQSVVPKKRRLVEIQPGASVTEEQALQILEAKRLKEEKGAKKRIKTETVDDDITRAINIKQEPKEKNIDPPKKPDKRRATKVAKGTSSSKRIRT